MFESLKSFAVAAGLVGVVLVGGVQARGFSGGAGASHIGTSHVPSSQNTGSIKQTSFQNTGKLNSFKPANTVAKVDNISNVDKISKLDKGNQFSKTNQFSKGKDNFLASKNKDFKCDKYSKCCKPGYGCWDSCFCGCWNWGCGGGYYGCGYDDCCCNCYYVPEYVTCCYASPAIVAAPVGQVGPAGQPAPAVAAHPVTVSNPATNESDLSFAIGSQTYTLKAGESKDVDATSDSEIQFDRGNGDTARYTLVDGTYTFGATATGWELYHGAATSDTTPIAKAASEKVADDVAAN